MKGLLVVLILTLSSVAMAENCAVIDMLSTNNGPFADLDMTPIDLSGTHATAKTGLFQVTLNLDPVTHLLTYEFKAHSGEVLAGLPLPLLLSTNLQVADGLESGQIVLSKPDDSGKAPKGYFVAKARIACED